MIPYGYFIFKFIAFLIDNVLRNLMLKNFVINIVINNFFNN